MSSNVAQVPGLRKGNIVRNRRSGMTLVELIVAFTILMVLSTMAVPLARYNVRRHQERDYRIALEEMRTAIDKYKDAVDAGKLGPDATGIDTFGYPKTLQSLVDGVKGTGPTADTKVKFLRRIPLDPFTRTREWGMHSMQDDPKSTGWGGQNVFDVFTKSTEKAADGTPYAEW
jgi:general secretion pathway protein G